MRSAVNVTARPPATDLSSLSWRDATPRLHTETPRLHTEITKASTLMASSTPHSFASERVDAEETTVNASRLVEPGDLSRTLVSTRTQTAIGAAMGLRLFGGDQVVDALKKIAGWMLQWGSA